MLMSDPEKIYSEFLLCGDMISSKEFTRQIFLRFPRAVECSIPWVYRLTLTVDGTGVIVDHDLVRILNPEHAADLINEIAQ